MGSRDIFAENITVASLTRCARQSFGKILFAPDDINFDGFLSHYFHIKYNIVLKNLLNVGYISYVYFLSDNSTDRLLEEISI